MKQFWMCMNDKGKHIERLRDLALDEVDIMLSDSEQLEWMDNWVDKQIEKEMGL